MIKDAARSGAKLIAFPETWLPGYPFHIWLDSLAWGMQYVQLYFDNSLVYGSPEAARISKAAKDSAIHVVMGHSARAVACTWVSGLLTIWDKRLRRDAS